MKLLLVEDDEKLASLIVTILNNQHYLVELATDGQIGLELAEIFDYNLILLDLMLPKLDGIQFCQRRRHKGDLTPIILLTGRDDPLCKVKALDAGADDYLVKPFDTQELLARIRALLRRGNPSSPPVLQWGDIALDPGNCVVTYQGQPLHLTAKEYEILELFLRNNQRIFSQSALIERLWSVDETPSENAVRTQIKSLRQKLKQAGASANLIETVYGLGYRLNSALIEKQTTESALNPSSALSYQVLQKMWQRHKGQYLQRLTIVEKAVIDLKTGSLSKPLREQAIREAHTLTGALGSFGFEQASGQAREIEDLLKRETHSSQIDKLYLSKLVEALRRELENGQTDKSSTVNSIPDYYQSSQTQNYQILIIDDDLVLAEALLTEAKLWRMQAEIANNLSQARHKLSFQRPDLILLDLNFPQEGENGLKLLAELQKVNPPIPTIVLTAHKSLKKRVKVARLGAKGFLQKPISPRKVMETITQVLQECSFPTAKLMIVDDDRNLLEFIKASLEPCGFQLTLLDNSKQFWHTLEKVRPDLLILDVEMPEFSGLDLCQVVRNDPQWNTLPILFISAHTETKTIKEGWQVGADDYIHKPIVTSELVGRIFHHLEKERRRQLADIDTLNGIANRQKSLQDLTRLINLAKRQKKPLCFIVINLDNFQFIKQQYGYGVGDLVLRSFGELLKSTFRTEDVIAHWGEQEFVLGLYNIDLDAGIKRVTDLSKSWCQQVFVLESDRSFHSSFSAGVAQYPKDGQDIQTLYLMANQALSSQRITEYVNS